MCVVSLYLSVWCWSSLCALVGLLSWFLAAAFGHTEHTIRLEQTKARALGESELLCWFHKLNTLVPFCAGNEIIIVVVAAVAPSVL